jgi:2-polyprenyl-6-methoxyphenol hydroxylase-like FAD-dependent oxidoreductase
VATVIVCGGSVIGLSTAMLLARDGHEVTVLERCAQPVPPPDRAWDGWDRTGVAQFRQPHVLLARTRHVLDTELPGLTAALIAAGCVRFDALASVPPALEGWQRTPEDARFTSVTGRRPVVEAVLAAVAVAQPGVTVRRGTGVTGLLPGPEVLPGVPHVAGVRLADGSDLHADLVIDATGRQSKLAGWLTALGGRPPYEDAEDSGFVYYTRHFTGQDRPPQRGPVAAPVGTISLLTLPGDNSTWSVTIWTAAADKALRPLREPDRFMAVVAQCPLQAHWLQGEPLTDVLVMAGVMDRYRRFVVGDQPVATGALAVGDAWACTNPSAGRGISVGLMHAQALRDALRAAGQDPVELAWEFDRLTEAGITPYYRGQIAADRAQLAQIAALRDGKAAPPPADPVAAGFMAGIGHDPVLFRGLLDITSCLSHPAEVLARPDIRERALAHAGSTGFTLPGPDRARLLELVST